MYQALYRKYRPKTFEEIVGQDVIVKTLKNSIKNNIVSHAYLLSGPRGTGKTSVAKLFAKTLNCHNPKNFEPCNECISCEQANNNQNIDIIEMDAASNNGVDEIREIRNKITLVPTNSKYKIYIIDEVHMLTNQAFNALLKTLEEPPPHIIFIFATTEPHKIPKTILSRCQRFDYKKVSNNKIVERLKFISESEKINITDEALNEIARLSDGGMRDSISLLDQALAYSDDQITISDIHDINGTLLPEEIDEFVLKILNKDLVGLLNSLEEYDNSGKNIIKIVQELIEKLKDCLIYISAPSLIEHNDSFYEKINNINNKKEIYNYIKSLSALIGEMKSVNNSKLLLEIELIKNITNNIEKFDDELKKESIEKVKPNIQELAAGVKCAEVPKTIKNEEKIGYDKEKLKKLKNIRVHNSLCKFSQREREKLKINLNRLDEYLSDIEYGKYVSLIKDGELKAVSDDYLMFMYKTELMAESFNLELIKIESLLEKCLLNSYKAIAIDLNDWDFIKNDYNQHKENYKYQIENISLIDIFKTEKNEEKINSNSIDDMFNDIIEYE